MCASVGIGAGEGVREGAKGGFWRRGYSRGEPFFTRAMAPGYGWGRPFRAQFRWVVSNPGAVPRAPPEAPRWGSVSMGGWNPGAMPRARRGVPVRGGLGAAAGSTAFAALKPWLLPRSHRGRKKPKGRCCGARLVQGVGGQEGARRSMRGLGRQCQLAQDWGESPLASRRVLSAPASRRNRIVSSEA